MRLTAANRLGEFGYHIHLRDLAPGETFPAHCHEFCEWFLVSGGELRQELNGVSALLPEGSLQLIFADDTHSLSCHGNRPARFYNIHVSKTRLRKDLAALSDTLPVPLNDCVQRIAPLPPEAYQSLLYKVKLLLNAGTGLTGALFRLATEEALWLLASRTRDAASAPAPPEWLREVHLQMHLAEHYVAGLPRMVQLSGRTPEHLCRMFRLHYGMTPREFVLEQRLQGAIHQLEMGKNVAEAARASGFQNLSYFRECFQARFAILPRQYRKEFSGA